MCSFQLRELSICTPRYFVFLDYFELVVANFQIQVFISTFEDIMPLLGGDKHGIFATFKESLLP